jgi:hypothetical protein
MEPSLVVKSKPLGSGIPASLKAYPEQVEVRTVRSPREVDVQTVRNDEISRVEIERGMTLAELKVKIRDLLSGETLLVGGLSVDDAERTKAFIEERMGHDTRVGVSRVTHTPDQHRSNEKSHGPEDPGPLRGVYPCIPMGAGLCRILCRISENLPTSTAVCTVIDPLA